MPDDTEKPATSPLIQSTGSGWVKTPPKSEGEYWHVKNGERMIVSIYDDDGELRFTYHGNECEYTVDEMNGGVWWPEPIPFPNVED